jgi:hypothetical protein
MSDSIIRDDHSSLMMKAVRTSETSVGNHFTRQYIPEDKSEHIQNLLDSFMFYKHQNIKYVISDTMVP